MQHFYFFIDTCYWIERKGFYVEEPYDPKTYEDLEEAKAKCMAAGDCKAVATDNTECNGNYRVIHGVATFKAHADWKRYGLISYEHTCEQRGN